MPYDEDRLRAAAAEVLDEVWADEGLRTHVQDQFLRYLLKSRPWPLAGVQGLALKSFDVRVPADLPATLRAESRHLGEELALFLIRLTTANELGTLLADITATLWRDRRLMDDQDFLDRLVATPTAPGVLGHLRELFGRVRNRPEVSGYVMDVLVHSLQQAMTHLFLVEGSAQDEVVGSHAILGVTHARRPIDPAFYVSERNHDGNGATRLVNWTWRWSCWDSKSSCRIGSTARRSRPSWPVTLPLQPSKGPLWYRASVNWTKSTASTRQR